MNDRLHQLAARIRSEILDLERVIERTREGWQRALRSGDDYYLDSVALNLHGFYAGLERLFELIAILVDGARPNGDNWHQALLQQRDETVGPCRLVVTNCARVGNRPGGAPCSSMW